MTLARQLLFITLLVVVLPLMPPLLSLLLPSHAPGRCFRTLALITYQFYKLCLFLRSFAPTNAPLYSIFRKLVGMTLPFTLILSVLLQRKISLFLFPLLLLSLLLWHCKRPNFLFLSAGSNANLKTGGLLKWKKR